MPRRAAILLALLGSALAAAGAASPGRAAGPIAPGGLGACTRASLKTVSAGNLTVGTGNPAYAPWFGGGTPAGSRWKLNDPATGKGFESALVYALAGELGFRRSTVKWLPVPFSKAFTRGRRDYDFDVDQISVTPARARVVTFSTSYYDVAEAVVVRKATPIASVRTLAGLRRFRLGAQLGTTSYDAIAADLGPRAKPAGFATAAAAVRALRGGRIDGLVADLPTAFHVASAQVPGAKVLGQLPGKPGGEQLGMVFTKGNPLAVCVDSALSRMRRSGALGKLQRRWLGQAAGAPVLK